MELAVGLALGICALGLALVAIACVMAGDDRDD